MSPSFIKETKISYVVVIGERADSFILVYLQIEWQLALCVRRYGASREQLYTTCSRQVIPPLDKLSQSVSRWKRMCDYRYGKGNQYK